MCFAELTAYAVSLSLPILTAIFPGEPGLASSTAATDNGSDNWSYKIRKTPVKSSLSTNQHPAFYR